MKELIEKIDETITDYDETLQEGMDHEQGYDFAGNMRDLLVDAVQVLKKHRPRMYSVIVAGESFKTFDNLDSAMDYMHRHIYIPPDNRKIMIKALEEGRKASISYGFQSAEISWEYLD